MTDRFFADIAPLAFDPAAATDLAFRHYDPDAVILGRRMEDHLRFAVAWWHSFAWPGTDPFGGPTFLRPWQGEDMDASAFTTPTSAPRARALPRAGAISRR
jgi:xylose isomerase